MLPIILGVGLGWLCLSILFAVAWVRFHRFVDEGDVSSRAVNPWVHATRSSVDDRLAEPEHALSA